jgi:hypothetical protein
MRPKIGVMEREWKKLEFGREDNKALVQLNINTNRLDFNSALN